MVICQLCHEPILDGDATPNDIPVLHLECAVRAIAGSAAHQLRECSCYGGTRDDPPGMSRRDAARLALETARTLRALRQADT